MKKFIKTLYWLCGGIFVLSFILLLFFLLIGEGELAAIFASLTGATGSTMVSLLFIDIVTDRYLGLYDPKR